MRVAEELQKWMAHFGWPASAQDRNFEILLGLLALALLAGLAFRKITTSFLTLRALALAPTLSRRVSDWVKSADYSENEVWGADGAGEGWVMLRKEAIDRLANFFRVHYAKSIAWGNEIRDSFSDLRFTDANRVPFPFMRVMRDKFQPSSVVTSSNGPHLRDLDDRLTLDVSGSYGLNVAGFDRYKDWIAAGWEHVKDLGPVLGPLHP